MRRNKRYSSKKTPEFRINEYITLRLEDDMTGIYINEEPFIQCKSLILNIPTVPIQNSKSIDDINSIDEASEILELSSQYDDELDPKSKFIGHCSNLQAWYEHDYDTRILHRNIAFPLLRKLTEAGDQKAKKVFKDEIAKRFKSYYPPVISFLIGGHYLDFLNTEELEVLLDGIGPDFGSYLISRFDYIQSIMPVFDAIFFLASVYRKLKKHDRVLEFLYWVLDNDFESIKGMSGKAILLHEIGREYEELNNFHCALRFYLESFRLSREIKDWDLISDTLFNVVTIYISQSKLIEALHLAWNGQDLNYHINKNDAIAPFYTRIALVFYRSGLFSEAIYYFKRSIKYFSLINEPACIGAQLNYIGLIFFSQTDYKNALIHYFHSEKYATDDQKGILFSNIGDCYSILGELSKAVRYFEDSRRYFKKYGNSENVAGIKLKIKYIMQEWGNKNIEKVRSYLHQINADYFYNL